MKLVKNVSEANCITHSGTMHSDEVFATAFLTLYLDEVRLLRTSKINLEDVSSKVFVYDIGRGEFDHHQADALKRENGITYSSFGLLWKKYGRDFLLKYGISLEDISAVFDGVDKDLIEAIDADDNGFFPKIEANYKVKTLSSVIKLFNPSYQSLQEEDQQFLKAVSMAKTILEEEIYYINGKVQADKEFNFLIKGIDLEKEKYLVLDKFIPYEESLLNNNLATNILFVAFPSNRGGYAIKTVSKSLEDRSARLLFPEEWAGLENADLERVTGIKGITFCHLGRFIISCENKEVVYEVLNKLCK